MPSSLVPGTCSIPSKRASACSRARARAPARARKVRVPEPVAPPERVRVPKSVPQPERSVSPCPKGACPRIRAPRPKGCVSPRRQARPQNPASPFEPVVFLLALGCDVTNIANKFARAGSELSPADRTGNIANAHSKLLLDPPLFDSFCIAIDAALVDTLCRSLDRASALRTEHSLKRRCLRATGGRSRPRRWR